MKRDMLSDDNKVFLINTHMKLKALHEDILGDLKRKLKGQVSLSDNIRRVAKQELKNALTRVETLEEIIDRDGPNAKSRGLFRETQKALAKAQKDLDRIK